MQDTEEHIIKKINPHWLVLLQTIVWYAIFIVVPVIWWQFIGQQIDAITRYVSSLSIIYIVFVVLISIYSIVSIYFWASSKGYITNSRIVLFRQKFKNSQIWSISYDKIENIAVKFPTKIAQMFNLGDIVFNSGEDAAIMRLVGRPKDLMNTVLELASKFNVEALPSQKVKEGKYEENVPKKRLNKVNNLKDADDKLVPLVTDDNVISPPFKVPELIQVGSEQPEKTPEALVTINELSEISLNADEWVMPDLSAASPFSTKPFTDSGVIELKEGEVVYL